MIRSVIFLLCSTFILLSCDRDDDTYQANEASFDFELLNENGESVSHVSNQSVDELEIDKSLAIWGNEFRPDFLSDRWQHDFPEPYQIFLHAEREENDEIGFISLNFSIPVGKELTPGEYQQVELNKERWLESLKRMWEMRQENAKGAQIQNNYQHPVLEHMHDIEPGNVTVNYFESGFGRSATPRIYAAMSGSMTLDEVTDEFVKGEFSVEVSGISWDFLEKSDFPENITTTNYQIVGSFTAGKGDYEDLREIRERLTPMRGIIPIL